MIPLEQSDIAEAQRFNRILNRAPRFRVRNRVAPMIIQSLLRLSQIGGDRHVKAAGLRVEETVAGTGSHKVPIRVLHPAGSVRGVVLDIHGGGWVIGNPRINDALNIALIKACDVAVVSVDYRLAVNTPVEGLLEDCLTAARWLLADGLPEYRDLPVFLIGESAGGHLAAATLLQLKQWPELLRRVAGTVLYYGVYDLAGTQSVRLAGPDTLVLDGLGMRTGLQILTPGLSDDERRRPPLSPLYGDLHDLPPALMVVGERDPLLDDTVEMADRWGKAADVELHRLPETPHGFIHFKTGMAAKVLAATHLWIKARLADVAQS